MKIDENLGHPGGGKTTLAASTVRYLKSQPHQGKHPMEVFYFFFRHDNPLGRSTIHAYRALLDQMLQRHHTNSDLVQKISSVMRNGDSIAGKMEESSMPALKELLQLCLPCLANPTIILDGVDECQDSDDLAKTLSSLMQIPPLKIAVFSRPNVLGIQTLIKEEDRLYFGQVEVDEDIKIFFRRQLREMVEGREKLLRPGIDIEESVNRLVVGADKMFLWARLMVSYLQCRALTPFRREMAIQKIASPEGLEAMYDRIFDLIGQSPKPQQQLATGILTWLIYSRRPASMTVEDLAMAAKHYNDDDGGDDDDLSQPWEGFRDAVSVVTCGLVTVHGNTNLPVKSLHLSTVDYIKQWRPAGSIVTQLDLLRPGRYTANLDLAIRSLQLILRSARRRHLSKAASLTVQYPFMTLYAASGWPLHLYSAVSMDAGDIWDLERYRPLIHRLQHVLSAFLATPNAVATFIEGFYTRSWEIEGNEKYSLPKLPWVLGFAKTWTNWVQQNPVLSDMLSPDIRVTFDEFSAFYNDMSNFADMWEKKAINNPSIVWDDALVFNTSRFLPRPELGHRVTLVPQNVNLGGGSSSRKLCHISAASTDGRVLGVLSVWPSAQYESFWRNLDPDAAYAQVESFCDGWLARYELRSTDGTYSHLSDIVIPLEPSEVALQMRQSFRHEHDVSWKTSFPMAISPNGLSLVILRTVYQISHESLLRSRPSWRSSILPLHTIDNLWDRWIESRLRPFNPVTSSLQCLPPTLRLLSRDWYRYSTTFSSDSRYLLFSDRFGPFTGHLVLFCVPENGGIRLIANTTYSCIKSRSIELTTFHPVLTILAFVSAGRVYVWDYGDGEWSSGFISGIL